MKADTSTIRDEVVGMLDHLPDHVLAHLQRYISGLVYDDEGVLNADTVAALDAPAERFYTSKGIELKRFGHVLDDDEDDV